MGTEAVFYGSNSHPVKYLAEKLRAFPVFVSPVFHCAPCGEALDPGCRADKPREASLYEFTRTPESSN